MSPPTSSDLSSPAMSSFLSQASAALSPTSPIILKDMFRFGEPSPTLANTLLRLAISGHKTATTSWPVPSPLYWGVGDYSIILDGDNNPGALMRTTEMTTCMFKDVQDDFALAEGEGTVEDYKQGHREFYHRQWERDEKSYQSFGEDSEVLCERFEVVYVREDLQQGAQVGAKGAAR
ncbi:PUA-like domain-containing protein [Podospora fimiseda]|uniref:PUA-like domain-containing protein n=1 Tax=Podospora fimiseda TaxID=252190 RepID=A0AAN7BI74_9PEZI|nr:PUA-like domain-containing protein [Podospora fimiseda]